VLVGEDVDVWSRVEMNREKFKVEEALGICLACPRSGGERKCSASSQASSQLHFEG